MAIPTRLLLVLVALVAFGCAPADDGREATGSPRPSPGVELEGAKLTETDGGATVWELEAERVAYRTEAQIAELEGVKTRFMEEGKTASVGTAPRAVFHMDSRRLELLGGIRVSSNDGTTGFEAEQVVWQPGPGLLEASGDVRFWRGANRLTSATLSADRGLRRVTMAGGVAGRARLGTDGEGAGSIPVPWPSIMEKTP